MALNEQEKLFLLAYRLCEARLRKPGTTFFSEAEILEDFPHHHITHIPRGQWCEVKPVTESLCLDIYKGLTYGN
jgi:hypothetical protein